MARIPVVDFTCFQPRTTPLFSDENDSLKDLVTAVWTALSTHGFMYVKNHGLPESTFNGVLHSSASFFQLPTDVKNKFKRSSALSNQGWTPQRGERIDPDAHADLKETIDYFPLSYEKVMSWAVEEVPTFLADFEQCYKQLHELARRVLSIIALGLGEEMNYFEKYHKLNGRLGNTTILRSLYYPPLPDGFVSQPGQMRLGDHTDYGSITLLFQDDIGGLEVCTRDGVYIPATPIPGTILVNIGDVIQMWTSGKLLSNRHRVVMPDADSIHKDRRSIAFFFYPDDDVIITYKDQDGNPRETRVLDHINHKLSSTINMQSTY